MKKVFLAVFAFFVIIFSPFSVVLANDTGGTQGPTTGTETKEKKLPSDNNNVLGLSDADLRSGNVNMDTIPLVLSTIINTIIYLSGTISAFMLIYFAVKMQLASGITGDSSGVDSAKKGMIAAGVGFAISISAWFLMARIMEILVNVTQ